MLARTVLTLAFVFIAGTPAVVAQDASSPTVSVSYELSRDRFHYRFENPSTFDTAELVPHEFTQTYWGDNQWLAVTASYRAGRRALQTEFAATPQRTTRGDDFDTFFQPSGDVVVSGTTGNVSLRSLRFRQTVSLGRAAGVSWHVGYQYRRDRSIFHPGTKIVTHTQPPALSEPGRVEGPSREVSIISTRETTISNVHEVQFVGTRDWNRPGSWRARLEIAVAPTTNARLTTILPDKYPGQEILFTAVVLTVTPRFTITHGDRWPLSLAIGGTRTFSYVDRRQFERTAATAMVSFGWTPR